MHYLNDRTEHFQRYLRCLIGLGTGQTLFFNQERRIDHGSLDANKGQKFAGQGSLNP